MMTTDHEGAAPIRTPDQRLRVFVSSTLAELAPERAAVAQAISALRLTPVMFELGARPHPPRELYRAYLAQSDVFVGLYWQRYGWIGPGMDISGLEDELRLSEGMPRLLYLKSPAPEQEPRLAAMIADLQSAGADSYRSLPERHASSAGSCVTTWRSCSANGSRRRPRLPRPRRPRRPTRSRSPRRSWPAPSTSLLGRGDAIAELSSLLESPDVRLVTLTGPGGIGKTRLAIAVGAALDEAGRRTAFVPLASITDPALVLPRVAAAVGAPIEGTRLGARHPDRALRADPDAARPRQPRAGDRRGDGAGSAALGVSRRHGPGHEPHRAAPAGRAGVPRRGADRAGVRRTAAARGARRAPRRAPVRRPGAGRASRFHPG